MAIDTGSVNLRDEYDYLAPDGSEIYLLVNGTHGSLCLCSLPENATSKPVSHKTVEEIWYFIAGEGQVWRKGLCEDKPVAVSKGSSIVIPPQTPFQFRNTGTSLLKIMITTMPPWPGPHESNDVTGYW